MRHIKFNGTMNGPELVTTLNSLSLELDKMKEELNTVLTETILLSPEIKNKSVYEMTYEEYSELTERL